MNLQMKVSNFRIYEFCEIIQHKFSFETLTMNLLQLPTLFKGFEWNPLLNFYFENDIEQYDLEA